MRCRKLNKAGCCNGGMFFQCPVAFGRGQCPFLALQRCQVQAGNMSTVNDASHDFLFGGSSEVLIVGLLRSRSLPLVELSGPHPECGGVDEAFPEVLLDTLIVRRVDCWNEEVRPRTFHRFTTVYR